MPDRQMNTAYMKRLELLIPPPLVMLILGAIMWLLPAIFPALTLTWLQRAAVGALISLLGLIISLAGIATFRHANTTIDPKRPADAASLVSSGIYRYSRNPMYLGVLLVLIGWAVYLGNMLSVLAALAFIPFITRFQIMPEERLLTDKFPSEFPAYMRTVRRWL
ncbi:isoprenylcysteine carboxylmethyltransferase family protein [Castellaniella sp.]|uniref:methyltransferase family protein n=1 Tax=Castellaniella sp. TaxID=1955812 RepID=UPI002AFE9801|nr:isoprenylcysteine carboxylmethyltransferase family protein [Castellaniella sp.]